MTDVVVMFDRTEKPIEGDVLKELLVLCRKGRVRRVEHYAAPRSRGVGTWHACPSKPLTKSQRACVEGTP